MDRKIVNRGFSGTRSMEESLREKEGRRVAREAAAAGIVLLKNEEGILPLKEGCALALYGAGASHTIKGGTGSGDVNERSSVSIYEGMKNAGFVITNDSWIRDYDKTYAAAREAWRDDLYEKNKDGGPFGFFLVYSNNPFSMPTGRAIDREKDVKDDKSLAFYVLSRICGEGADRFNKPGDYLLTEEEHRMLADICEIYDSVIVVLNAGGQVDLSFMDEFENIRGLIQMAQPGMEGGNAFADVVSGKVCPSGKLVDTYAYKYEDYPNWENYSHNNGNTDAEVYEEGIYVGYRYFDSYEIPVRYGFGFGLSYTDFDIKAGTLSFEQEEEEQLICLRATVTNTGDREGKEVVQLYASLPEGKLEKENRRLVAFIKTDELDAGKSQRVMLELPVKCLASYDEEKAAWILEAGDYGLWIGNSLEASVPAGIVEIPETIVLEQDKNVCVPEQEISEFHRDPEKIHARCAAMAEMITEAGVPVLELTGNMVKTEKIIYRKNAELTEEEPRRFVDGLTRDQLIALSAGDPGRAQGSSNLGSAGSAIPGSAAQTSMAAMDQNLASIALADGPAGLRLMKFYFVKDGEIVTQPFEFSLEGGYFVPDAEQTEGERYNQYCTAIPTGVALAQSWDTDLVAMTGEMIGKEMLEFGVTLWLAPGMCIHRNPLCGRNFEYYSEDPVLSGEIAAAMTNGVQRNPGVGTTIKHFACNNQEDNRMASDSIVSERVLREIYIRGFEIAVKKSQPMALMTSYNLINGVHAANSYDLITDVLRNEWGFCGAVMTDWTTTMNLDDPNGATADGCMRAGNDMIMPGAPCDYDALNKALDEGSLSMEDLKACVSRTVSIIWQSNMYEGAVPYRK
ncbi:MAG: glycoside hydrolase family 3 C-terminal domain-containing protein [Eubacterium sp.]|nr:glycoside hydrolase family 3 C-terminal domain-containing protein [Eubacterium sp.]